MISSAYISTNSTFQADTEAQTEEGEKEADDTDFLNFEQIQYEYIRETLKEFSAVFRDRLSKKTRLRASPMRIELRDDVPI